MYIDTGISVPTIPSKSHDLADENKKVFDGMEMIRNNRIVINDVLYHVRTYYTVTISYHRST